jgi:arsenite methyltransferase
VSEYGEELLAAGFEAISVEPTHEVADGIHGAIVRAVVPDPKTTEEV